MTCFDFTESEVGTYGEVIMAVIVAPFVKPGEPFPKSAFYPYLVATTTPESRKHAIERWHLPHWMADVSVDFEGADGQRSCRIGCDGETVAELTISDYQWKPVSHLYQSFMNDDAGAYQANIVMEGEQSEHEEEKGKLVLHDHAFNKDLDITEVWDVPFRELWMRNGIQTFDPLITLSV
jgi:hypothetical protein